MPETTPGELVPGRRLNELSFPANPVGAEVYAEKAGVSVRVKVGDPGGLATLDESGGIPSEQMKFQQAGTGSISRTMQDKNREHVTPEDFGAIGDGNSHPLSERYASLAAAQVVYPFATALTREIDDCAIVAACLASTQVHFLKKTYCVNFANFSEVDPMVAYANKSSVTITGDGALLYDQHAYGVQSATPVFKFTNCKKIRISGVDYEGQPIADKSNAVSGIGYAGASFVFLAGNCDDVRVDARLKYLRYGIRAGSYADSSFGNNNNVGGRLTTFECGYPVALYLSDNVDFFIDAESGHRAAYLAGVRGGKIDVAVKDWYIAPIPVLLTDAYVSAGVSRGCANLRVNAWDKGSTTFIPNSNLVGISLSRVDPGTVYENIDVNVQVKATDTVCTTVGAFRLDSTVNSVLPAYTFNWEQTIFLRNIKLSGVLDRSAQTLQEHNGGGEIYIYTLDGTEAAGHYATVEGLDISNFTYKPGTGAKPRGFWLFNPGAVGAHSFTNCNFGTATPCTFRTNATSQTSYKNVVMRGSYSGTSEPSLSSVAVFDSCTIASMAYQPTLNKTFINTTVNGGGIKHFRIMNELTLTGASVTWANSLPGQSIILGVSGRLTEDIIGSTGFQVGDGTTVGRFANSNATTIGSTFAPGNSSDASPRIQGSTGSITVTSKTSNFTGGKIRLFVDYINFTPPTS